MRSFSLLLWAVGAALCLCAGAAPCGAATFAAKADYPTGANPYSLASGDFNRDGNLDLAVANRSSNTVSIFLGHADGTFAPKVDYPTGTNPLFVVASDWNRDGIPDLAVSNTGSDTVSILIGKGDGTFGAKTDYAVGTNPYGVAVGDFNGDGKIDLAVANFSAASVSVLLGDGSGAFAAKVDYPTGTNPRSLAIGDFNRDGHLDLAISNYGSDTVSILLGRGDGTFNAKADYSTGRNPLAVVANDFNGDGNPDLAISNSGDGTVSILIGSASGAFGGKTNFSTGATPASIAVADFDGDAHLDLAVANYGSNNLSFLAGKGNGAFSPKADTAIGSNPYFVLSGDFNHDGASDLAVANYGANTLSVLLNTTTAPVATPSALFSEFRLSGPGGLGDEFIELANATGASVDVSGWSVVAGGVTVPLSGVIAARGHLLLANAGGYSLGGAAPADLSYSGDIPTGSSLCLKNAGGTVVDTVSAPIASPASATDQYAYVRRLESGAPSNTGNTTTDFNLVDTSATSSTVGASGVGALGGARLGSPNPHNAASTVQRNDGISNKAMNIPGVYSIARYPSKGSAIDPQGRLTIRRTIVNTTGASVSKLRFRIVAITGGMSTASGVADLRALSSGGVRYYDGNGQLQRGAYGLTLDAPTTPNEAPLKSIAQGSSGNGGGLNAGWTVPLPGGTLAAGASVNVEFLFGIQAEGQFRIVVDAEVLP